MWVSIGKTRNSMRESKRYIVLTYWDWVKWDEQDLEIKKNLRRKRLVLWCRGTSQGCSINTQQEKTSKLDEMEPCKCHYVIGVHVCFCFAKLTIIKYCSPTINTDEADKDTFYALLQREICQIIKHDILMVMVNINAKIEEMKDRRNPETGRNW